MTDTQAQPMPDFVTRDNEVKHDDGSLTIPLFYPITTPTGDNITTVTLTRVKQKTMKELRKRHKNDMDNFGDAMLLSASHLTEEDLGEMDMEDYTYISERFSIMVGFGSSTGTK